MDRNAEIPRVALAIGLVVPLAVVMGVLLVSPLATPTVALVGLTFMALAFPLWIRWHHTLLVCFWNAAVVAFFIPGQPPVWVLLASLSLGIAVVSRTLRHRSEFLWVRSLAVPLLVLV